MSADAKPAPPPPPRPPRHVTHRALLWRFGMVLLLASAISLVFWTVNRLVRLQNEARDLSMLMSRLDGEIDQMEGRWTPVEVERLLSDFNRLPEQVFAGQESLATWLRDLRQHLVPLALEADAEFGQAAFDALTNSPVAAIPATVSIRFEPSESVESFKSPYQRLLRLTQYLGALSRRVDLVQLSVTGGTNSVAHAVAVLQLWAATPDLQ